MMAVASYRHPIYKGRCKTRRHNTIICHSKEKKGGIETEYQEEVKRKNHAVFRRHAILVRKSGFLIAPIMPWSLLWK